MALITSDHRTTMLQGIPGVGMAPTEGVVHAAEALLKLVSRRRFQCPFRTRRVLERFLERFCTVFAGGSGDRRRRTHAERGGGVGAQRQQRHRRAAPVSHGFQLQSLLIIPAAAVRH